MTQIVKTRRGTAGRDLQPQSRYERVEYLADCLSGDFPSIGVSISLTLGLFVHHMLYGLVWFVSTDQLPICRRLCRTRSLEHAVEQFADVP